MRIGLAQINPTIGDMRGNLLKIINNIKKAESNNCDLVVFPELCISGYPPMDLLLRTDFIEECQKAIEEIKFHTEDIGVLIGTITTTEGDRGNCLFNSGLLIHKGKICGQANKSLLPNYDVFEESRYFKPSDSAKCLSFKGLKLGVTICEDIWNIQGYYGERRYSRDILSELYSENPDMFINLSASPYHYNKHGIRLNMISHIVSKYHIPFIYVNQVGGNDELIFDGSSVVYDSSGNLIHHGKIFKEDLLIYDTSKDYSSIIIEEDISWMYKALVLGMRDYFEKTGFKKTLLGLSGGIDSALVACIAVDALGKDNVLGVSMPSRYTSQHSKDDAAALAANLGIENITIPIEEVFNNYLSIFNKDNISRGDLAEENIQARIRGNFLMFISNREDRMLISTSNKSETAVGYSTLYGDMCGGLSIIGDVPKTIVYDMCEYVNRNKEIIPINILEKPPSAELRPDQKDEDSLPPYSVLDKVIQMYIEEYCSLNEIAKEIGDYDMVVKILNMIDRAEYKRRQGPPILRVTSHAFGMGRKIPIVQKFRRI